MRPAARYAVAGCVVLVVLVLALEMTAYIYARAQPDGKQTEAMLRWSMGARAAASKELGRTRAEESCDVAIAEKEASCATAMTHMKNAKLDCSRSMAESSGFVCVDDVSWNTTKKIAQRQGVKHGYKYEAMCEGKHPDELKGQPCSPRCSWYSIFFEPEFSCPLKERVGSIGDGGKYVCHSPTLAKDNCLMYSVGSNNDFSFEIGFHEIWPHCAIHTFDPTVKGKVNNPPFVQFHPWGIVRRSAPISETATPDSALWLSLQDVMRRLNHTGREIAVFKIDIEGGEYDFIEGLYAEIFFPMAQIQMEVHSPKKNGRLFLLLRQGGYAIFSKEINYLSQNCHEYAFARVGRSFFENNRDRLVLDNMTCSA
ncbi:hypothetical protein FVE85_8868 [Porphyridium purpureum]|uniref:Methyltransferase domain-containing protein n=1 Tax=Porphyridium purpureum TaxID=35688 RepID=A0A5J4YRK9_PORPP|nr:hypothetical protein FVE85_8868 [Porphyridium purpureum]|eukprot:POR2208..scf296_7